MEQLDLRTLSIAILQIAEEKGIQEEKVVEVIEMALASAYKKEYGEKEERYRAIFDKKNGNVSFSLVKKVLNDDMILNEEDEQQEEAEGAEEEKPQKVKFNPARHIMIEEALKLKEAKKDTKAGDSIEFPLKSPEKFGRIAAQTAKQVLLQRIKEAERENIFNEFSKKEGEILSGVVQRKKNDIVFVDIGRITALLLREEQVPGEFYKTGSRMRFFCLKVKESSRGPEIHLSRTHPKFLSKLFELEVPEILSGTVEIKAIARDPGLRSKVAVFSEEEGIDPIGSCVGARGTRVNAVIQELGREKVDIVNYSKDPSEFIKNSFSPAKIIKVKIKEEKAEVLVAKDQLSLTIGRDGQNVRLASDLTGWKIDIIEERENEDGISEKKEEEKS